MMISRLLDAFWSPQELAGFSISGKAAPGHAKETAKPKLPSDNLRAITSKSVFHKAEEDNLMTISFFLDFTLDRWNKWHNQTLDKTAINRSIGAHLTSFHTKMKKDQKKLACVDLNQELSEV